MDLDEPAKADQEPFNSFDCPAASELSSINETHCSEAAHWRLNRYAMNFRSDRHFKLLWLSLQASPLATNALPCPTKYSRT